MRDLFILFLIISSMSVWAKSTDQDWLYSADISTGEVRLVGDIALETDLPIKTLSVDFGPVWQVEAGQLMALHFNLPTAMEYCRLKVREFGMPRSDNAETTAMLINGNRVQRLYIAQPNALQTRFYDLVQNLPSGDNVLKLGGLDQDLGIQSVIINCTTSSVATFGKTYQSLESAIRVETGPNSFRDRLKDESFGPDMVLIPAGEYQMGDVQGDGYNDEKPVHSVSISAFAMSKYEITFAEYDQFVQATGNKKPADEGWGRDKHPVINVSWDDAVAYAEWLTQQTGQTYRLPSEAEWEYAARAGTETKYWWGNQWDNTQANGQVGENGGDDGFQYTAPVGTFNANAFGLHDMLGNVREWVADPWHKNYGGAYHDGRIWNYKDEEEQKEMSKHRPLRGGSWNEEPVDCRVSSRDWNILVDSRTVGFRVVLVE